ncbi:hypothetical protein [Anaerophaga thermohalophila]|jgi:hypothetical protein|uniref:hypothetical protein n=1 Tax=Anaerophaga thermohalophila TaxID=177400 RepID=UPI0003668F66|nr:hypothetical protein [Anaerophaga thermohalophila]
MKPLFFVLFSVFLLIIGCKSHSQGSKEVVVDPIVPSPYEVEYDPHVVLPDSLGGGKYNGLAAIKGIINDNLKIENVKIMKLQLFTSKQDTVIDYYYGMDSLSLKWCYPPKVSEYLPFFEDFVKTVSIKRRKESSVKDISQITLMVRFK